MLKKILIKLSKILSSAKYLAPKSPLNSRKSTGSEHEKTVIQRVSQGQTGSLGGAQQLTGGGVVTEMFRALKKNIQWGGGGSSRYVS